VQGGSDNTVTMKAYSERGMDLGSSTEILTHMTGRKTVTYFLLEKKTGSETTRLAWFFRRTIYFLN
ncbi:MAG: hypothetical protein MPJ22_02765, partial [Pirellulales bacterium]|nr:hypothetical protein [Pirellulales bacterium]